MASAGDLALAQTLENLKLKNNEYLQNPTARTEANMSEAMSRQASALADRGGVVKQSHEMRMVKQDFEKTTDPGRKFNIAHKLANTLVGISVKKFATWTILGTTSVGGLAYALYDINANGEVVAWRDTTGDGWIDTAHVDTNNDAVADYALQDTDGNSHVDRIAGMDENGEVAEVVGEGGVLESLIEGLEIGGNGELAEVAVEGGVVESLIEGLGNMLGLFG